MATNRAAQRGLGEGVTLALHDVADVPLYNGDLEDAGVPASVQALHEAVGAADGLLLFSPEYNGSFPAVTKNVIDWLTRPPKSWEGTAVSMVVTTPGPRAGQSFRGHFDTIMGFQPVRLLASHGIGSYGEKLDDQGELVDTEAVAELTEFVARFAAFAAEEQD